MAYLALYRQYRPRTFSEVVGQEPITRTLQNQVQTGRIAHAYLFCGSRGTGKTSTAKILARAINCLHPQQGEPCGTCAFCRLSEEEIATDVQEIDAASNNGVDEIRDLREKVRYAPSIATYKVYIIDEVHMLSDGAFNALLKTLEEPPQHTVFILATTETHKLPATILSRCQRFDFKRLSEHVLIEHMQAILEKQSVQADDAALALIAKSAEGGMRDALSLLDQCLSYAGDRLDESCALQVLGAAGQETTEQMVQALGAQDAAKALNILAQVYQNGTDLGVFTRQLIDVYRAQMLHDAQQGGGQAAMQAVCVLSQAETDMRKTPRPRVTLEAALVRLCMQEKTQDMQGVLARIERLEQRMQNAPGTEGSAQIPEGLLERLERLEQRSQNGTSPAPAAKRAPAAASPQQRTPAPVSPTTVEPSDLLPRISAALRQINKLAGQFLSQAKQVIPQEQQLLFCFAEEDDVLIAALRQHQQDVEQAVRQVLPGEERTIEFSTAAVHRQLEQDEADLLQKAQQAFGMAVEIEE